MLSGTSPKWEASAISWTWITEHHNSLLNEVKFKCHLKKQLKQNNWGFFLPQKHYCTNLTFASPQAKASWFTGDFPVWTITVNAVNYSKLWFYKPINFWKTHKKWQAQIIILPFHQCIKKIAWLEQNDIGSRWYFLLFLYINQGTIPGEHFQVALPHFWRFSEEKGCFLFKWGVLFWSHVSLKLYKETFFHSKTTLYLQLKTKKITCGGLNFYQLLFLCWSPVIDITRIF